MSAADQTGRVLGPVETPALSNDQDIALDVLGDKLLRLAQELTRGVIDVHTRMEAIGALDRAALCIPLPHCHTARLQAKALRERAETLTAEVVKGWRVVWEDLGDELAGLVSRSVLVEDVARELEDGGEFIEAELVRVSPDRARAYLAPRPMIACDEPPVGVAGDMPISAASVEGAVL